MHQKIAVLGSTGSIGRQALEVAKQLNMKITALAAHSNIELLEKQVRIWKPAIAAVMDEKSAHEFALKIKDTNTKAVSGLNGVCEAAAESGADILLNAVVGMAGLLPTLTAIESGLDIALANKETLVAGGDLVMKAAKDRGVRILPVDSEHSAVFQCLQGAPPDKTPVRIILTASGGPFFGKTLDELKQVQPEDALKHPNWEMGAKITVDSATLMNKGLEIIEAVHLFSLPPSSIDVVIHRESIVHSMVEYIDHSVIAQLGLPDMRLPIQYALSYPNRYPSPGERLDLTQIQKLTFYPPDPDTFVCLNAAAEAIGRGGLYPAAVNAANEQAVKLFLERKISFLEIGNLVISVLTQTQKSGAYSLEDLFEADRLSREYVLRTASYL